MDWTEPRRRHFFRLDKTQKIALALRTCVASIHKRNCSCRLVDRDNGSVAGQSRTPSQIKRKSRRGGQRSTACSYKRTAVPEIVWFVSSPQRDCVNDLHRLFPGKTAPLPVQCVSEIKERRPTVDGLFL